MKIVLLLDTLRQGTGGVASVLDLAEALQDLGSEVTLVVLRYDSQFARTLSAYNCRPGLTALPVVYAPGLAWHWSRAGWWAVWRSDLRRLSRDGGRSVLRRAMDGAASIGASWCRRATAAIRGADVIISAAALTSGQTQSIRTRSSALLVRNHAGSPEVYEEHFLQRWQYSGQVSGTGAYVSFCLQFDRILFQSPIHAEACAIRDSRLGARVATVEPGCDEVAVAAAASAPSPYRDGEDVAAVVATVQARKGQRAAVAVLGSLAESAPALRLHLVGDARIDSVYVRAVAEDVSRAGLESRVVWHGHRSDYLRFLTHASVLLVTSQAEGIPRVVREAMCAGVPVAGFALSGLAELLGPLGSRALVPPGDVASLCAAVRSLWADPSARQQLADVQRERYMTVCSRVRYVEAVARVRQEWASSRAGARQTKGGGA